MSAILVLGFNQVLSSAHDKLTGAPVVCNCLAYQSTVLAYRLFKSRVTQVVTHYSAESTLPGRTRHPHILHLASGDLWAGAEVQLFTLAKTLAHDLHVRVSVVLLNHGVLETRLQESGIMVTVLDEEKLGFFRIVSQLTEIIKAQGVDVIHTHRFKENIIGSIAGLYAGRLPSMRTVHGMPEQRPRWWQITRILIRRADRLCGRYLQSRIIAVSTELADRLIQIYPHEKVITIKNGIDITALAGIREAISHRRSNRPEPTRVGIACRLVAIKRVDLFIRAARSYLDHYTDTSIDYYIYGDGPLREELVRLNRELGTDKIVKFSGHVSDIHRALAELDVLMITSDHEGLPMILLEGMALGIPAVAHATGGIPEVLDQGKCGILVTEHSPDGYANGLHLLLSNPQLRSDISSWAMQRVMNQFNAELNARGYLTIYNIINRPSSHPHLKR